MGDHPVGVREGPGREGVGRKALVHERERTREIRIVQVGIVGAELVGEEHAFVDNGPAGDRHRVIARQPALAPRIDSARNPFAQHVEPALELVLALDLLAAADEHLLVHRFGRLDGPAERRVVGRDVAPAEQRHALFLDILGVDVANDLPPVRVARHEQIADSIFAGFGQLEAEPVGLLHEEGMRDLHQDAGAVARARVGADRAAVLQIAQDGERVLDQLLRLAALDVGDEADAAGILLERRIVKSLRRRQAGIGLLLGRPSGGPVALPAALSCAHAGPRLSRHIRERRNQNSKLPLRLLRRGMRLRTATPTAHAGLLKTAGPQASLGDRAANWDSNTVLTYLCKF